MQFKHPENLYFLVLLLIPIIVHLFQLQRFVKVPFTNVAFLKKLALQTRKSSRIKKWLILATRLLLFSALIIAFAQPYFSNHKSDQQQHFLIYLDNSLSTNTDGEKGNLLQLASQEILENISEKATYSLITNDEFHKNKTASDLKDILLKVKNTAKKTELKDVLLKISTENKTNILSENIIISDFQNVKKEELLSSPKNTSFVKLNPQQKSNLSIDSVFISDNGTTNFQVNILVKNQGIFKKNVPIAIYNKEKLINKQLFSIEENKTQKVVFSILKTTDFSGKIELNFKDTYTFDNSFYFAINSNTKTAVLNIGEPAGFLNRIYTKEAFDFTSSTIKNLKYNLIQKQHLIVLNEIDNIPENLIACLIEFTKNGGNLVVIPSRDLTISSYSSLFNKLKIGKLLSKKTDNLKITTINYKHPILKNVFEKNVSNFQYPFVKTAYNTQLLNASTVVSFENKQGFIQQVNLTNSAIYWVAAPLSKENSNFINSPLVVPVFYNIGKYSLQLSKLYYTIGEPSVIDINKQLGKDEIVTISNNQTSFIPLQQTLQNSVKITTTDQPLVAGFYQIKQEASILKNSAFNYPKKESLLNFLDSENLNSKTTANSVKNTLNNINSENKIQWLWKWFLALAIVSLLIEILILKFFKP
ncbi:BatA domain-containing protein [Tenacibaculum sp. AHE15PA]|uniref:BatA domain-containing protein n=1 Tax=unclassified Tenacibaculum TaxID=2635139 RepID=UPI001C4F2223|nr:MULTISPECIES: BatA domain-containing protein [unclassified Tenacibaculum]QXP74729.1 BatA domain-containing protein [Tenacibaculum sp. AHE14PA]QXP76240.1 BatA domain-containing protein [Tenacibaculum sp. AHE15PA]